MSLSGANHFKRAWPRILSFAAFFAELPGGMPAHLPPVPKPLPEGMRRGQRSRFYLFHYPSPHSAKHGGYVTDEGHATDETTRMLERAVNSSHNSVNLTFDQHFDYIADIYDGPHPFKVGKVDFTFDKHFYNSKKLNPKQMADWRAGKVDILKNIIVDEIVERGRVGADVLVTGVQAQKWWPSLLAEAVPLAREEARVILGLADLPPFDLAFPSEQRGELPSLPDDAKCADSEVQHPCGALKCMSPGHRARVDAAIQFAQRGVLPEDAIVEYFQALSPKHGNFNDTERKQLQADAKALAGGYDGPSPLDKELTEEQKKARTEAISKEQSMRSRGGSKVVKAAADAAAVGHEEAVGRLEEIKTQKQASGSALGSAYGSANGSAHGKVNGKKGAKKIREDAAAERPPIAWVKIRLLSGGGAVSCPVRRGSNQIRKNSAGHQVVYPGTCKTTLGHYPISFPRCGRAKGEYIVIKGTKVAVMVDDYTPHPPPPLSSTHPPLRV